MECLRNIFLTSPLGPCRGLEAYKIPPLEDGGIDADERLMLEDEVRG